MSQTINNSPKNPYEKLRELASIFLKLGIVGFGGPPAHIAMINEEAVVKRNWLSQEQFTEGLAICEMLPGPASTQMGIYTGYVYAGQLGALTAGLCFISPAFLIVVALSWGYFRTSELPQIADLLLGISPVITAIILNFCLKLGKKSFKKPSDMAIAIAVFCLTLFFKINILIQFIIAGLIGLLIYRSPPSNSPRQFNNLSFPFFPIYLAQTNSEILTLSSFWGTERIQQFFLPLTLFFLKVGSFIFGGGLVIIPLLEFEVVENLQWLNHNEFINGVAIGQISPGPVVLTAAFIGYKVAGFLGALVATAAIFTPSFIFIMIAAPFLRRVRQNLAMQNFLKGVNPAVLGATAAAAIPIAQAALWQEKILLSLGGLTILIFALLALLRYRVATWKLIILGGILGLILGTIL
ncbi:MAG: chromate efflux transporter [Xenococcaceae cyanobacterium]